MYYIAIGNSVLRTYASVKVTGFSVLQTKSRPLGLLESSTVLILGQSADLYFFLTFCSSVGVLCLLISSAGKIEDHSL